MITRVAEIDMDELTARIAEEVSGRKRPAGMSAREAVESLGEEQAEAWRRAAETASEYIADCIEKAKTVQ